MLLDIKPIPTREAVIETIAETLRSINDNSCLAVNRLDSIETHVEDSLDLADLAFRLESAYNVQIVNLQLRPLTRIEDLADTIRTMLIDGSLAMNEAKEPTGKEVAETAATPASRVMVSGSDLIIGGVRLPLQPLKIEWKSWSGVESALKTLKRSPTEQEWAVLRKLPETPAAKNGFSETKSALERTSAA